MAYEAALTIQRNVHEQVLAGAAPPTLLLVEHDPVITIGRRPGARAHLRADEGTLARLGIAVAESDRGGDITYHGPGQVVAYPIVRLEPLRLNVGRYLRRLEQIAIDTAAAFGVEAMRLERCTGVWIDGAPPRKLCALGVRVRRNVTLHGMAFNVETDLSHYDTIVPCGIADKGVTSLRDLLGAAAPDMAAVRAELAARAQRHLGDGEPPA